MHIGFDIWICGTGFGFSIWIWEKRFSPTVILGFEGQIKLLNKELANWSWDWERKDFE